MDFYTIRYANAHKYPDGDLYIDAHPNSNGFQHTDRHFYTYSNLYIDAYTNPDCFPYAPVYPDSE